MDGRDGCKVRKGKCSCQIDLGGESRIARELGKPAFLEEHGLERDHGEGLRLDYFERVYSDIPSGGILLWLLVRSPASLQAGRFAVYAEGGQGEVLSLLQAASR